MRGVQALGLLLPASGRLQVSINVIDVEAAPLVAVVERVREAAAAAGSSSGRASSSGCCRRAPSAEPRALGLEALPDDRVLERRL